MPRATPADASNDSRVGGRPPWSPYAAAGSERSTTRPSACSSATRLETVERERPVRRAMSAREMSPSSRSASITRSRLRRRKVSRDPVRPTATAVSEPIAARLSRERTNPAVRPTRFVQITIEWWVGSDRVGVGRHHDRAGRLVLPRLLLLVPQHPEVAQEERDARHDADEVAHEGTPVTDRPTAAAEVVDADAERLLAERLAGRSTLEVHVVGDADE